MKTYKYYFAAFTAFLIWGFFSLALKPLRNFPSLDILFYRVFLSSIVMLLIDLFKGLRSMYLCWKVVYGGYCIGYMIVYTSDVDGAAYLKLK